MSEEHYDDDDRVDLSASEFNIHLKTARQSGIMDALTYVQDVLVSQKNRITSDDFNFGELEESVGMKLDEPSFLVGFGSAATVVLSVAYHTYEDIEKSHGHEVPSLDDRINGILQRPMILPP